MNPTFPGRLSTPYTDGAYRLYPNSLLFKSGSYPDKSFSMTPEELAAAANAFTAPVPVNLEHAPAMLVGKLGEVRAAYVDPDAPEELRGVVAIPTWLDAQLTDEERQVSSEFNRQTKQLVGLALTPSPRVEGAALMTAFSNASAGEGGAKPQAVEDGRKAHPMNDFWDKLKALFSEAGIKVDKDETANFKALESKVDKLADAVATLAEGKKTDPTPDPTKKATFSEADAKQKAAEFVSELLADHRCLPAERPAIEQGFIAAFRADTAVASFSGDVLLTPTLDAFKASQKARQPHQLTTELLVDQSPDAVLFAYGPEGKPKTEKAKTPGEITEMHNGRYNASVYGTSMNGGR